MHTVEDLEAYAEAVIDDIVREFPAWDWIKDELTVVVRTDRRAKHLRGRAFLAAYGHEKHGMIWLYHNTLKEAPDLGIEDTIRHEVAHHIAYRLGSTGHGKLWQQIADTIHAYPVAVSNDDERIEYAASKGRA